jgi:hypothetical protein
MWLSVEVLREYHPTVHGGFAQCQGVVCVGQFVGSAIHAPVDGWVAGLDDSIS